MGFTDVFANTPAICANRLGARITNSAGWPVAISTSTDAWTSAAMNAEPVVSPVATQGSVPVPPAYTAAEKAELVTFDQAIVIIRA